MKQKKILILGNSKLTVFGFRGELIQKLINLGYNVYVSFPNGPFGEGEQISKEYKCHFIETNISRRGTNPIDDLKLLNQYIKIIKKINPSMVLAFTVKCDIYGGLACRFLKVPFMPNITGLGKGLTEGKITKIITKFLYRISIKKSKCVFFQNENDKEFFIKNKIKFQDCVVLPGSGVNLDKFKILSYPNSKKIKFLYLARIMKAKGIDEYLEAAKEIKEENENVEFHICGYCEEDYKNIIDDYSNKNIIIYHGLVDDVVNYMKDCHCVVLPSFHPEGISNVLLEAAASARPIITTNMVGCKDTIINNKTGYLVEKKNASDLINKINKFIKLSNSEKKIMGLEGRNYVQDKFDRNKVIEEYLKKI